jgi:DNA-binding NarL/FixJ family response regulator
MENGNGHAGVRVVIADDHPAIIDAVVHYLEDEADVVVVGQASSGDRALQLIEQQAPDVAVLDIRMPQLNGLDGAQRIRKVSPRTRIVLLTMHPEEQYVAAALRAGVQGFVLKTQAAQDLVRAIREVVGGAVYLSPRVSQLVAEASVGKREISADPLTPREREVLQLVAEGKATKQVAAALGISPKTAESHRTRIMRKLDIHEVAGLVRYAIRSGLVSP